jgi:hypothetical protein
VRAHGATPEALFAHWINECLYVHEVEGFAWRRIDFAVFDAESRAGAEPMRLHSFLHGASLEPGGSPPRGAMASISVGAVSLRALGDEFELSIAGADEDPSAEVRRPRPPCHVTREIIGRTNFRLRGPDMAPHSASGSASNRVA